MSVILGTLLVPLSAFAASTIVESTGPSDSSIGGEPSPVADTAITESGALATDLEAACGEAGLAMVAEEAAGSIGGLQQAALDALRGVCAEQEMPLPTPPTTHQVVSTAAPASPPVPSIDQAVASGDDDHGRHGGDDHDDDDDHGRHGDDDDDDDHGEDHD
ncbi:MAG TPA: hypothetical protein VHM29_05980 [Acidimicrobiia bacterium]|nr:hypothetical protein [Acidimicrobiia bacterium]